MDLQYIEASLQRTAGPFAELLDQGSNLFNFQGARHRALFGERNRRGRHPYHTWQVGIAAGVADLRTHLGAETVQQVDQAFQASDVRVAPDSQVAFADAGVLVHRQGLREDQAGLALGTGTVVHAVPVGDEAVFCGHVHAHRRHDDTVTQFQTVQFERGKQQAHVGGSIGSNDGLMLSYANILCKYAHFCAVGTF